MEMILNSEGINETQLLKKKRYNSNFYSTKITLLSNIYKVTCSNNQLTLMSICIQEFKSNRDNNDKKTDGNENLFLAKPFFEKKCVQQDINSLFSFSTQISGNTFFAGKSMKTKENIVLKYFLSYHNIDKEITSICAYQDLSEIKYEELSNCTAYTIEINEKMKVNNNDKEYSRFLNTIHRHITKSLDYQQNKRGLFIKLTMKKKTGSI